MQGQGNPKLLPYNAALVEKIYLDELSPKNGVTDSSRLILLEFSSYLEKYVLNHGLNCCF